jgi:hypothetical protein
MNLEGLGTFAPDASLNASYYAQRSGLLADIVFQRQIPRGATLHAK